MSFEANFPNECLEDIFLHLSGKDLLLCTLVCPDWNDCVGSTRSCMAKIKLGCTDVSFKESIKIILTNSERRYECLHVEGRYQEDLQKMLSLKGRRWTQISSSHLYFKTTKHFLDFLRAYQSSVEKLFLYCLSGEEGSFESSDLQFP